MKLRKSVLYMEFIPESVDRDQLNREIEIEIQEQGMEDDDLVDTWTYFYEEAAYEDLFHFEEGLGADDV